MSKIMRAFSSLLFLTAVGVSGCENGHSDALSDDLMPEGKADSQPACRLNEVWASLGHSAFAMSLRMDNYIYTKDPTAAKAASLAIKGAFFQALVTPEGFGRSDLEWTCEDGEGWCAEPADIDANVRLAWRGQPTAKSLLEAHGLVLEEEGYFASDQEAGLPVATLRTGYYPNGFTEQDPDTRRWDIIGGGASYGLAHEELEVRKVRLSYQDECLDAVVVRPAGGDSAWELISPQSPR